MRKLIFVLIIIMGLSSISYADTQNRLPTGDGSLNFTPFPASPATNYDKIDDPIGTPDEDTTYIYRSDTNQTDEYTFTAFDITSTSIASITVTARARIAAGSGQTLKVGIQVNLTDYLGATDHAITGSYANYSDTWTTNPNTGSAWVEADVEGTGLSPLERIRVRALTMTAGDTTYVTQLYMTVNYTAVGGSTERRRLMIID